MPELTNSKPHAGVALYDLDGTLIAWDCQLLFRHFVIRREPWRAVWLPVFLAALPLAGLLGAARMKRVFLSYLWRMDPETLSRYSREFAVVVVRAVFPELRESIQRDREAGRLLVLASASPEFYVSEIGRELGFDVSLGTPVELGPIFPRLKNHKGHEKAERLKRVLPKGLFDGGRLRGGHGYTDSLADLPMLGLCEGATLVNPSLAMVELAKNAGWRILRPCRPWNHRWGFMWRTMALLVGLGRDPGRLNGQ